MHEVFITKYALTQGLFKLRGDIDAQGNFMGKTAFGGVWFFPKNDFACTEAEAEDQVAKKLIAKIKSTEKALAKLRATNPALLVQNSRPVKVP